MVDRPVVVWNKQAYASLKRFYKTIKKDSPVNAEKVRSDIIKITGHLAEHPEKYPPDKFKKDNPGNYRAFEKHSYRIAYRHTADEIRILRIRHVKKEPREY